MFFVLVIPFALLWFTFRKWRFADGQRRFIWGTFVACSLAWVLLLIGWMLFPLGGGPW